MPNEEKDEIRKIMKRNERSYANVRPSARISGRTTARTNSVRDVSARKKTVLDNSVFDEKEKEKEIEIEKE